MDAAAAPDLNGARIQVPNAPEVWLVFHGLRHHVANAAVYDALFSSIDLLELESVEPILRGPDLVDGTCLASSEEGGAIFLLTGFPDEEIRKHHIRSYESFVDFGFDEAKVRRLPKLAIAGIRTGREIRSAAD